MLNFWISVITVIVTLGLVNAGMQDHQISRIGSRDAEIRTQDQDANLPSKLSQQTLPTPPDEPQL